MFKMKVLSWNARGLKSQTKQHLLKKKVQKEQLDIVFVQETKCSSSTVISISKKLGKRMEYLETANNGWKGGLIILWNPKVMQLLSSEAARSYIAIKFQVVRNSETYLCTNIYGP